MVLESGMLGLDLGLRPMTTGLGLEYCGLDLEGLVNLAFVYPILPVSAYVFHCSKFQECMELIALNVSSFNSICMIR